MGKNQKKIKKLIISNCYCPLPIAYRPLPIAYRLLPIVHGLIFTCCINNSLFHKGCVFFNTKGRGNKGPKNIKSPALGQPRLFRNHIFIVALSPSLHLSPKDSSFADVQQFICPVDVLLSCRKLGGLDRLHELMAQAAN